MQLDRVPPRIVSAQLTGTTEFLPGVRPFGDRQREAVGSLAGIRRRRASEWVALSLACLSLLGQGERCRIDPRLSSPGETLKTYWQAVRSNDVAAVTDCFVERDLATPAAGMLWFLPPIQSLAIDSLRVVTVTSARVVVSYAVRFRPLGAERDRYFVNSSELVRVRGEWRLERALDEDGPSQPVPAPPAVDI
ncbi:MAG: hypothetical protein E6K73_12430 [Candidatus Eisenbacteria bacterium]|uniref:Uncharacterized protein n=1 Tax=Eiseniibacteriota bacterium TaxID=2212470 RepID=A0A538SA45_UNCEI|nr:MAG: hypothetical protein E6K73_12430 [Candidatus Eisenbacteria bacterium]